MFITDVVVGKIGRTVSKDDELTARKVGVRSRPRGEEERVDTNEDEELDGVHGTADAPGAPVLLNQT